MSAATGIGPLPPSLPVTRDALHLVAARVLGAARYLAVGRMGLTVSGGGFATPEFDGRRLLVDGTELCDGERREAMSTLGRACAFAGVDPDAPLHPALALAGSSDTELRVDPPAAAALADWFARGQAVLEAFAAASRPDEAVTAIQLWPEHFDLALEAGEPASRANYGASPGDALIAVPYFYVGPHQPRQGDFWNAPFGAVLTHADVRAGADPSEFLQRARHVLAGSASD